MYCSRRVLAYLLPALLLSGVGSAEEASTQVPLPVGLADPVGRTGFLPNATGGLDVVDLTTGELLWETKEAQQPLLLLGPRLYAQSAVGTNGLRVLAFDLMEQGPCVLASDPVLFPGWVSLSERPGRSFAARWHRDRNRLVLSWQASAWNDAGPRLLRLTGQPAATGALNNAVILSGKVNTLERPAKRQQASGRAAFDLQTGKAELLGDAPEGAAASTPPPPHDAAKLVLRWQGERAGKFMALTLDLEPGQRALVLRSWDRVTNKPAVPKVLMRGQRLAILPTVDGRYLCLRDVMPRPDKLLVGPGSGRPTWSVFAPETGNLVARLPFEPGTQALALVGPRAYLLVAGPLRGPIDRPHVRPQVLKAIEIKSGKVLWERPVEGKPCVPIGT